MIMAVLAGPFGNIIDQFAVDLLLITLLVVLCLMALKTSVIGDKTVVSGIFALLQKQGLFRGFDRLIGISFEMRDSQFHRPLVYFPNSLNSRVKMAVDAI